MRSSEKYNFLHSWAVWLLVAQGPICCGADEPVTKILFADPAYDILREDPDSAGPYAEFKVHPLLPALRYAYGRYERLRQDVQDYTCLTHRRERVGGKLRGSNVFWAKVRHPHKTSGLEATAYSVYLKFVGPKDVRGREVLYVDGGYSNRLIMTAGGSGALSKVTLSLHPTGKRALAASRHPITKFGMLNTVADLLQRGMTEMLQDQHPTEWDVQFYRHAKVGERDCTCVQVRRTVYRDEFTFYLVRCFVDNELDVPIRFTTFALPPEPGGPPRLAEAYTYTKVRLNVGLEDTDFDVSNSDYGFDESRVQVGSTQAVGLKTDGLR